MIRACDRIRPKRLFNFATLMIMAREMIVLTGILAIALTISACVEPGRLEDESTIAAPSEEIELPPLWTEGEGEVTLYCPARNGYQEATISLPPSSPFTDELNDLLHTYDGRPPLTILSVRETEPGFSFEDPSRIDETTYLSTVTIASPEGELELERYDREVDVTSLLADSRLTGWNKQTERPELSDWAQDLTRRIDFEYDFDEWSEVDGEDRNTSTFYMATEYFPTQVDSVTLRWGSSLGFSECQPI